MRGTQPARIETLSRERIIPAHAGNSWAPVAPETASTDHPRAGNSPRSASTGRHVPDHPRACGELGSPSAKDLSNAGSSPRMRGTRLKPNDLHRLFRIIPAHAGNSEPPSIFQSLSPDHPRACGELFAVTISWFSGAGSSPRMRGTPRLPAGPQRRSRIIPAHAGNSRTHARARSGPSDHPRACGELASRVVTGEINCGSSPRMRGTRRPDAVHLRRHRIIPAHAGNSRRRPCQYAAVTDHPRACGELRIACSME